MTERDRRDPSNQRPRSGGRRGVDPPAGDPPYQTYECATWMGVDPEWIRNAITLGVWSKSESKLVQLEAEYLPGPSCESRGEYRIYQDAFITFLQRIGWSRVPAKR